MKRIMALGLVMGGLACGSGSEETPPVSAGTSEETRRCAIERGLRESSDSGVRLIGEITTPPCDYPSSDGSWPELVTFAEVLGLSPQRGSERLAAAIQHNAANEHAAWSPHAPYSTSLDLIESCVQRSIHTNRPLAMHVAESPAERELLTSGSGPFAETLQGLGVWRDGLFPWCDDPLGMLIDKLSQAPRVLLIHGNDLRPSEIERLSQHSHISVVFCPRTHAFFQHDRHPIDQLTAAGVRVALGTDSRASNPDLNLWREVQFLLQHRVDLAPSGVLAMATTAAADALGRSDKGRIEVGCRAELGYVKTTATKPDELHEDLAQGEYTPLPIRNR